MNVIPRPEYPRPDFVRKDWLNLNGCWSFQFDDEDKGLDCKWWDNPGFAQNITVPFPFQAELSGIGDTGFHDVFWYHRDVMIPDEWLAEKRLLLHIGAFDYQGMLWINGQKAGEHRGGYSPWTTDITDYIADGRARIVIRGFDTQSPSQPRGKQHWELHSSGIMYTRVSGIWQTVWIEPVPVTYIEAIRIIPALDPDRLKLIVKIQGKVDNALLSVHIFKGTLTVVTAETSAAGGEHTIELQIPEARRWSPADPFLYDVRIALGTDGRIIDEVSTYAGIREIRREGRAILLNNEPVILKGVLDQGYFPCGIYTPQREDEFRRDVELTLALGFNCARKHQKVEDPRWYYWCDRLGLLVWGEMGNAWEFTPESCQNLIHEWPEVMRRDWNHPCIMAWVPLNESWGVPKVHEDKEQQKFQKQMATLTRALDPTRPVVDNSGWCHLDTDIVDLHPYTGDPNEMAALLETVLETGRVDKNYPMPLWVGDGKDEGQPIVISEYGGIALQSDVERSRDQKDPWGYGRAADSSEILVRRFRELTRAILKNSRIAGYVYTQLTDVEQEKNGLLTFDREPKAPIYLFAGAQSLPENEQETSGNVDQA